MSTFTQYREFVDLMYSVNGNSLKTSGESVVDLVISSETLIVSYQSTSVLSFTY